MKYHHELVCVGKASFTAIPCCAVATDNSTSNCGVEHEVGITNAYARFSAGDGRKQCDIYVAALLFRRTANGANR